MAIVPAIGNGFILLGDENIEFNTKNIVLKNMLTIMKTIWKNLK